MLVFQRRRARKVLKLARLLATLDDHARAARAPSRETAHRRTRLTLV